MPQAMTAESPLRYPCGDAPLAGQAKTVAPGVLWLRIPLPTSTMGINVWAVRDGAGWAVFDTGMYTEQAQQIWRALCAPDGALGGPPTRVFGTHLHADHIGMAGWLCRSHGCELWMTRTEYLQARVLIADKDAAASPQALDFYRDAGWSAEALAQYRPMGRFTAPLPDAYRRLQDGQHLRIGEHVWQVVVGNGHSPEHACFYCAELGVLISGDQVLPAISSNVSVSHAEPLANPMQDWLDSLAKVRDSVPHDVLVLPAHHDPFVGLHPRIDRLAAKRHQALDKLRQHLAAAPRQVADTFEVLFGRSRFADVFTQQLATGEAIAYLNYLVQRGEARMQRDADGMPCYQACA